MRGPRYKLVNVERRGNDKDLQIQWALYDLDTDPGEKKNVIDDHSQEAEQLKQAYDHWFDDVSSTRGYPVPKIIAGTKHENPVTLTRQDWRGPQASWDGKGLGYWDVDFATAGKYDVTVRMPAVEGKSVVRLQIGDIKKSESVEAGATSANVIANLELPEGTAPRAGHGRARWKAGGRALRGSGMCRCGAVTSLSQIVAYVSPRSDYLPHVVLRRRTTRRDHEPNRDLQSRMAEVCKNEAGRTHWSGLPVCN